MTTIKDDIEIKGIGLVDGKESIIKITPSEKKGIFFYPDSDFDAVKASLENVVSTFHCTILGNNAGQIRVVEHFMAACAFAGIDSLNVYLSGSEIPILDGSAKIWVQAFKNAGIEGKTKLDCQIKLEEPIYYSKANIHLILLPAETFKITYSVNYEHPDLERKWFSWDISDEHDQIIEARTFGFLKDLEKFQKAGFALGVNIDNTVGLTENGYTAALRSQDEPIKHKILDLIGDLNLAGINIFDLNAHIIAQEAGHGAHVDFTKKVYKALGREICL